MIVICIHSMIYFLEFRGAWIFQSHYPNAWNRYPYSNDWLHEMIAHFIRDIINSLAHYMVKATTGGLWPGFLPPVVALNILLPGHSSIWKASSQNLTVMQMVKQIAGITNNRFIYHIPTDRGDHHNLGPRVCDGSTQLPMAMKQSCYRGCWRALSTPSGGLNQLLLWGENIPLASLTLLHSFSKETHHG